MLTHRSGVLVIVVLVAIGLLNALSAQVLHDTHFHKQTETGLTAVYNMNFRSAEATFSQLKTEYPDHPGPYVLSALNTLWQLSLDERYTGFDPSIQADLNRALTLNKPLENQPGYEVEHLICQLSILSLQSRLQGCRSNWAGSANTARKCISLIKESESLLPESKEFLFYQGTYDYFVDAYPAKYPIVKPLMLFFPDGDRNKGMRELGECAGQRLMTQGEAAYQLALILLDYERDYPKALRISQQLHKRFPQNSIFTLMYGMAAYQNKQYAQAEKALGSLEATFIQLPGHDDHRITPSQSRVTSRIMMEVYYYAGLVQMIEYEANERAADYFRKSRKMATLSDFEDHDLFVGALYHLGVCQDRLQERENALLTYREVIKKDKSNGYKPRAQKCLETPCTANF